MGRFGRALAPLCVAHCQAGIGRLGGSQLSVSSRQRHDPSMVGDVKNTVGSEHCRTNFPADMISVSVR